MRAVSASESSVHALDLALSTITSKSSGLAQQVAAASCSLDNRVREEVKTLEAELSAALSFGGEAEVRIATERLDKARRAQAKAAELAQRVRRIGRDVDHLGLTIGTARKDLAERVNALSNYSQIASPVQSVSSVAVSLPGAVKLVDVADVSFEDNPILDDFTRGGLSKSDYIWAVETWADVVRPGVEQGMTREEFAERDKSRNAAPLRRSADIYELFLGDSKIVVDRTSGGALSVTNGRHRLQVARELGISNLPMRVTGQTS